ncbi:hypothetical protein LUZ63_003964 [Rhynchospora breviuscula]|uniref:Uncharacterized protein n=1 Tax=Rhynchospora breviuscula TaxID=2022672 RepID=A0A9Q0D1L1_9POAL|nr:hypothetical protein LUZ63_003964 [Rhynchospora breviuscula]
MLIAPTPNLPSMVSFPIRRLLFHRLVSRMASASIDLADSLRGQRKRGQSSSHLSRVVGHQNNPLYLQSFTGSDDALKLRHIVHCSLDVIDERATSAEKIKYKKAATPSNVVYASGSGYLKVLLQAYSPPTQADLKLPERTWLLLRMSTFNILKGSSGWCREITLKIRFNS